MSQLTISAANSGGSTYNLTTLGDADWLTYPGSTTLVKKAVTNALALAFTGGATTNTSFNGTTTTLTWSDGTPTASGTTNGGVYTGTAAGQGYQITAPADTTVRTLRIYAGCFQSTLKVIATLSDGSSPAITDTSTTHTGSGNALQREFTIVYAAASAGQTLVVTLTNNAGGGNLNLQGAALSPAVSGGGSGATAVTLSGPSSGTVGTASSNFTIGANGTLTGSVTVTPSDGGQGGTFAPPSVTISSGTPTATCTYAAASTGAKTISVTNNGGLTNPSSITFTAGAAPTQVANSDANVFWSPYTWDDYGTYKSANSCGSYAKVGFTGTSITAKLDVSHMVAASLPAGQYPIVRMLIDGATATDTQLTSSTTGLTVSGLAAGSHTLELIFNAAYTTVPDRWNTPVSAVRVTGFTLDGGASTQAPAVRSKRAIYYGDSITEGYLAYGNGQQQPSGNSAANTAVPSLMQALGCEYGQIGYGAQGYVTAGQGNVPTFNAAYGLYSSGRSRLVSGKLSPVPDYVFIEHGANGATAQADVATAITNMRTIAPTAKIFIMVPAGGFARAAIATAVAASGDANVFAIDLGTTYQPGITSYSNGASLWSQDGLHRNTLCNARVAAGYADKVQAVLDGAAQPTLTARTVTLTLGDSTGALANLAGIKVAAFDEPTPDLRSAPRYKSSTQVTNASGVLTFSMQSTLAVGGQCGVSVQLADGRNFDVAGVVA